MIRKTFLRNCLLFAAGLSSLIFAETGYNWGNVAIGGGGFVSSIVASQVDQNLFYARTDVGGAYRWDNANSKWVSMMDWVDVSERGLLGVEAIMVDPKISNKVYMVAGTSYWNDGRSAFLRSSDRGVTWDVIYTWDTTGVKGTAVKKFGAHGNGMGRGTGERLAIDPNNSDIMFYGSKNKGMFKSTDNGSTWNHVDAFTTAAGSDTTWNGSGFSFILYSAKSSDTIYAGFLRENNNMFRSTDGGASWSSLTIPVSLMTTSGGSRVRLMPQRAVTSSDGLKLTVTMADGAGPHTMAWSEGWGMIYDGFGRGAVFQYDVTAATWSDVSPEDFIDQTGSSKTAIFDHVDVEGLQGCAANDTACSNSKYPYLPPYGGISINPGNSDEMLVTHLGYWACQYWSASTSKWAGSWASNVYRTINGGKSWVPFFSSDYEPRVQLTDGGIGWINGNSLHWAGSVAFDPFNTERAWATSGNGVFRTDNLTAYQYDSSTYPYMINSGTTQQWAFTAHGIEETVPEEVISIPGGPLVSIIGDYDGYRHDDITKYPSFRHKTNVSGAAVSLGSTRGLAYAPKSGKLVKVADVRSVSANGSMVPIDPIQFSTDAGTSWSVVTYNIIDTSYTKGTVAISADGAVTLWTPAYKSGTSGSYPVKRYYNSAWTEVSGINGAYIVGDPVDATVFYAYQKSDGTMYKSTDNGATFAKVGEPGTSDYKKFRLVPGITGDIWVPLTSNGLTRSTDGGATFTKLSNVSYCEAVGFGKASEGKTFPAVYIYGKVGDVTGVFQSIDEGATWTRVNDDAHEYGGLANGEFVVGDMNTFGVVYMSTAGRGIAARMPSTWVGTKKFSKTASQQTNALVKLNRNILSINVVKAASPFNVAVYDLQGKTVYSKSFGKAVSLSMKSLIRTNGTFIVTVRNGKNVMFNEQLRLID